jgi:SAM-dependent methyltransferase
MTSYHEYVFDQSKRKFVGEFEAMYRQEGVSGFDSWHQDDIHSREDASVILRQFEGRHFEWLVDLGCGKGALTNALSGVANSSLGVDVSPTAVHIARGRYPHLDFQVADLNDSNTVRELLRSLKNSESPSVLVVMSQVLSYLSEWREVVMAVSGNSNEFVVGLYLPDDPIGFVKSRDELEIEMRNCARVLSWHESVDSHQHVVFASAESEK